MILEIAGAVLAVGWLLVLAAIGFGGRLGHLWTALIVFAGSVGSFWLRQVRLRASLYWLIGACIAAVACEKWLFPASPAQYYFPVVVVMASLLVSGRGVFAIATAAALACVAVARLQAVSWLDGSQVTTPLLLIYLTALAAWLSSRQIHMALGCMQSSYNQARQLLEEVRDRRMTLARTNKALEEAYARIERMNYALIEARSAAEEARRIKAEFVANVSHELRTPLNMIIGFSEMMLRAPRAYGRIPAALKADLAVILRNSHHLADLIDDVLDLSQIEAGQMALTRERVTLGEIVSAAAEAIRPLFESKGLYLTAEVPEALMVFCDRTRLREVLLNLLSNAGRFTEQGGVHVQASVAGHEVVVSVADTGPGIAPEDQGRLFQPFQQADGSIRRRYGGSGLGLSISKHFVEMHGGRMWLESQPGRGTTISFALPLEPPAPAAEVFRRWLNPEWEYRQRTRQLAVPAPAARPRLVVAEKGTLLQRLLRRYLENVEIAPVRNLEEAGSEIAQRPAQALLVNDVSVGQTLERLRGSGLLPFGTPALVCSLPGEEEAAQSLGVAGYLVKPVSQESLVGALDRLGLAAGTILIVDDELDAIQLFWRMLASSGRSYRVLTAANGEQALSILRSEQVDAVLLDLVMPAMDGFQLLAKRHEEPGWGDVPVIVMSARDPSGQPIVADAVGIIRGGGLSAAQVLAYIGTLGNLVEGTEKEAQ